MFSGKSLLRDVIGQHMTELGQANDKVVLVNADLMGTCRNRKFNEMYPERSFNTGIAEANMVSFAAGMAHEGFIPYAFTMAPFMSMRACEQCRDDVAYAGLNVRLIATYAGYSGGISGATHWGLEDCAIIGSMGGMTVVEPSDPYEACCLLDDSVMYPGPIYMRSSVEPVSTIYDIDTKFEIGKAKVVREGNDGAFICSGVVVQFAIEAAEQIFKKYGKKICVIDMFTIKPIDEDAILKAASTNNVIVAQDHNVTGGLGYSVAAVLAKRGIGINYKVLGCVDEFIPMAHASYLYHKYEYDADGLEKNMINMLKI